MSRDYVPITDAEFAALAADDASGELAPWTASGNRLRATFAAPSFSAAGELAAAIAVVADELDHHPDLDLRYPGIVRVELTTHVTRSLTMVDVATARAITRAATAAGAVAQREDAAG